MFNFNYLNQVYGAPKLASYAPEEPLVSQAPQVYGPPPPPPMIGPPAPPPPAPEPVGPQFSAMPPTGPVASVQPEAPPPQPQGPAPGVNEQMVGISMPVAPHVAFMTAGRPAGELNTMGPNKLSYLQTAAKIEAGAAGRTADRVSGAMEGQQAPLDERAQYMTELAERESRDQGGRNEQNRQRLEDYDREAKELRDMKPDPGAYMKSGQGILDMIATVFGGIGQGYMRRAGDMNAENTGAKMAASNRARFDAQQGQAVANKRGYLEDVRRSMLAQRDMQNDQVASNQRAAGLRKEATGAKLDKAGIGVAIQEAVSRGDMGQAQALMKLAERQAAEQHYQAAQGGGRMHRMLINGQVVDLTEAQYNARALRHEDKGLDTASTIGIEGAKADGASKAKRAEDMDKRWVPRADHPNGGYATSSAEEGKAHREADIAGAQFKQTVQELKRLRGELGATDTLGINTEDARRIKGLQAQAAVSFGKMKGLGTYDAGMERLAEQIFGDPTGMRSPVANYDVLLDRIDADASIRARSPEGAMRPNMKDAAPSAERVK